MLRGIMNFGNDNRNGLNSKNNYKIRLAKILLNFENYKTNLEWLGVKSEMITLKDFTIIMQLGGGVYTKWDDIVQGTTSVFLEIQRCLELREKKILIYSKSPDEILSSINTNNAYLTNENDDSTNRKYLSTVVENITQASYLSSSQMLDRYLNSLLNPNQDFYCRVINSVASAYQPNIRPYHNRGDYR